MLRELLAVFGLEFDSSGADLAFDAIGGLYDEVTELGAAFTDNALVQGIQNFTNEVTESANAIRQVASQINAGTDNVQEWAHLFGMVGMEIDEVGATLVGLAEKAASATAPGEMADVFRDLGIEVLDANNQLKDSDTLMREVVQSMSEMPDAEARAALALKLFGDAGRKLIPILERGSAALDENSQEFQRLGGGLSEDAIAATLEYTLATSKLDVVMTSLKSEVAEFLIPAIASLVDWVAEGVNGFREMTEGTHVLEIAFGLLAAVTAAWAINTLIGFAPIIGTVLLIGAAVFLLVMFIDDLWTMFEGGQSVIGEFIDALFGIGTAAEVVEETKATWDGLWNFWAEHLDDMGGLWEELKDSLAYVWEEFVDGFYDYVAEALTSVVMRWTAFRDRVGNIIAAGVSPIIRFVGAIRAAWNDLTTGLTNAWLRFVMQVVQGAASVASAVRGVAAGLGFGSVVGAIDGAGRTAAGAKGTVAAPGAVGALAASRPVAGPVTIAPNTTNRFEITGATDPEATAEQVRAIVAEQNDQMVRRFADQTSRRIP